MTLKSHIRCAFAAAALFGLIPVGSALAGAPPVLRPGTSDHTDVALAQRALDATGFSLTIDGSFGPSTKTAVMTFQHRHGLEATGIIGPDTWASLQADQVHLTATAPTPPQRPTLREGSSHHSIVAGLQADLLALGYSIRADGYFGSGTTSVVRAFQRDHGVEATGAVGPTTWAALHSALAAFSKSSAPSADTPAFSILRLGSQGKQVLALQAQLQAEGYPLHPYGTFDHTTQAAVTAFQKAHLLTPNGQVDLATWKALFAGDPSRGGYVRTATYTVKNTEDAAQIAQKFGVTIPELLSANGLTQAAQIKPGSTLTIPSAATTAQRTTMSLGERLADDALLYIGVPYVWGGTSPQGFDCSGLVQFVAHLAGVTLPRTSTRQFHQGVPVKRQDLMPGDLVFFNTYGYASHVGIYVGNQRFVSAPESGQSVDVQRLTNPYWAARFIGARNLFAGG